MLVTIMHIVIISGTTATFFLLSHLNITPVQHWRIDSSVLVFTALQDIFLAFNMFFILDEGQRPDIIRDEATKVSYRLLKVVKEPSFSASIIDDSSSSSSESSEEEEGPLNVSQRIFD